MPTSRLRYGLPIVVFGALALMLSWALNRDPHEIPSALIGHPVPQFALPPVKGRTLGLSNVDLKDEVSLVNVFASWCVECRTEHPLLLQLKADGSLPIHGLNYKDSPIRRSLHAHRRRSQRPYSRFGEWAARQRSDLPRQMGPHLFWLYFLSRCLPDGAQQHQRGARKARLGREQAAAAFRHG
jgi:thiol-disulfide isomerase/thioredoxin